MVLNTIRCTTSVDIVRQQSYSTSSLHGVKRTHEQIHTSPIKGGALNDVTETAVDKPNKKRPRTDDVWVNSVAASKITDVLNNNPKSDYIPGAPSANLPGPSQNPLLALSHTRYGLPEILVKNFASMGISSIYPWQSSCLLGHGILSSARSLVYTAPTGGGKSLVADILMLKRVLENPFKKAILVLPYVALVQEKLKWLRKVVEGVRKSAGPLDQSEIQPSKWRKRHDSSIRIVGFFGGSRARAGWNDVDVAICTIEKVLWVPCI